MTTKQNFVTVLFSTISSESRGWVWGQRTRHPFSPPNHQLHDARSVGDLIDPISLSPVAPLLLQIIIIPFHLMILSFIYPPMDSIHLPSHTHTLSPYYLQLLLLLPLTGGQPIKSNTAQYCSIGYQSSTKGSRGNIPRLFEPCGIFGTETSPALHLNFLHFHHLE